jgi:hypothetical protein
MSFITPAIVIAVKIDKYVGVYCSNKPNAVPNNKSRNFKVSDNN